MILYDYQKNAVASTYQYLKEKKGVSPLIIAPTGAGKSIIIAQIIKDTYKHKRILKLTHKKDLLVQNYNKVSKIIPNIDIGFYCAGMKKKDTKTNIIFASIQSIAKNINKFKAFDLILIDEAHLININSESQYKKVLDFLKKCNSNLKCIGLTATPYRVDCGYLYGQNNSFFDGVSFDIKINYLIKNNYLCNPTSIASQVNINTQSIPIKNNKYNQKAHEMAFSREFIKTLQEITYKTQHRKKVIIFCSGVDHAKNVHLHMPNSEIVTGTTINREKILSRFLNNEFKFLINVDVLTTGFDDPAIDCVVILRAILSPSLFVQICGRGLRIAPNKKDCLILDFGHNFERHGCIDDIQVKIPKGKNEKREKIEKQNAKKCNKCCVINKIQAKVCIRCGEPFNNQLTNFNYSGNILTNAQTSNVIKIIYTFVKNKKDIEMLKISYLITGFKIIQEFICLDHYGYAYKIAIQKVRALKGTAKNINEAKSQFKLWKQPTKITYIKKDGFYNIINKEF